MATDLNEAFELSFGGIPFLLDKSTIVRLSVDTKEGLDPRQQVPAKHQPEPDLIDELSRKISPKWLNEFAPPKQFLKGNMSMLAFPHELTYRQVGIGELFYPSNASRWACGRFLASSSQVKKMVAKAIPAGGPSAQTFKMKCRPAGAAEFNEDDYTVETELYMLPPRPLSEMGGEFDGLFMVTLVDERWYWQWKPATLKPYDTTTWSSLIQDVLDALEIEATYNPTTLNSAYLQPQQDSQLWTNKENAAHLLDVALANVGRTLVRKLDGTYELIDYAESANVVNTNRADANSVILFGGGDIFYAGDKLPSGKRTSESTSAGGGQGNLLNAPDVRRAVLPKEVVVSFPYYVNGDDPVPHFLNSRYRPKRPSCWYEDSFGEVYTKTVATTSNTNGQGTHFIHSTAKALIDDETGVGSPSNQAALDALANQLAADYIDFVAGSALDEVYPGTYAWDAEGINDILWTYSAKSRQASTRIMRQEWNEMVREFQHAEGQPPKGVGGPSVAQSWHNFTPSSGTNFTTKIYNPLNLNGEIASGDYSATFETQDNFPTQNRWRAVIEKGLAGEEKVLMEGTSGGVDVDIVFRGIDGTNQIEHASGSNIEWIQDNFCYGVNDQLIEKMQPVFPGRWTSGGISQAVIVPQTQTVRALTGSGALIRSIQSYSGRVYSYDPSKPSGTQFHGLEYVWIQNRNHPQGPLQSGKYYDGQFAWFTASGSSGSVAPLYLVNDENVRFRTFLNHSGCIPWSGGITSGYLGVEPGIDLRVSGLASGWENGASLAIRSTEFASSGNSTIWWTVSGSVIQTVQVTDISGTLVDGIIFYSGTAYQFDRFAASGDEFVSGVPVRIVHRNPNPHWPLYSGWKYEGQWVGNMSGCSGSTFLVTDEKWRLSTTRSGGVTSGYHWPEPKIDFVVSGAYVSGQTSIDIRSHEFTDSGTVQVYFTVSGLQGTGGTGGVDIGFKALQSGTMVVSGGLTAAVYWNTERWDTHAFHAAGSGSLFSFLSGGIGKYQVELSIDSEVDFLSGTTTLTNKKQSADFLINGVGIEPEACGYAHRLVFPEIGTGTGNTIATLNAVCLHVGTHFDITATSDLLEVRVTNDADAGDNATFSAGVISFQKVNKAGTITSG